MKTLDRITILIVTLLVCWTYVWSVKYMPTPQDSQTITVDGEGKVKVNPDTLNIRLSVVETWATTAQAQKKMTEKITAVKELLAGYDVPTESIKTESMNVSPEYNWIDGERKLLGQQAHQMMNIELSGSGFQEQGSKIISMLPKAGNIEINSSDFYVSDIEAWVEEARALAFQNAKNKAEALAKLYGKKVWKVLSITDGSSSSREYYPTYMKATVNGMALDAVAEVEESSDLLSAGQNERRHAVQVVFEIE